ncbi:hypothetical protein KSS87_014604, partial [Heliosperma pusillum]
IGIHYIFTYYISPSFYIVDYVSIY